MVNFIVWLVAGAIIGGVVSYLLWQREGLLLNVAVGLAGAFIVGYGLTPLLDTSVISQNNFSPAALVISLLSAILLLAAVSLFRRGGLRLH